MGQPSLGPMWGVATVEHGNASKQGNTSEG